MNPSDEKFMAYALHQAEIASLQDEVPIGSVVVKDNVVVSSGYNQKEQTQNPCMHAEIVAIQNACLNQGNWRLLNCTIYVTVEPCIMCVGAILHARISRIVYGCDDFKWGGLKSKCNINQIPGLNHYVTVTGGILAKEGAHLLSAFFADKRLKKTNRLT